MTFPPEEQSGQKNRPSGGKDWSDLGQRLISAVVLAAVVIVITYSGIWPFALLVVFGGIILCWEWAKMVRKTDFDELLVVHVISILVSCALVVAQQHLVALLVLLIGPALKYGMTKDEDANRLGLSLVGVPYIGLPLLSLIWLRSSPEFGWLAILFLFVIVWAVDIFAYFTGRTFGGPKFAPRISPKKTWSGFVGGVVAGVLAGVLFGTLLGGTSLWKIGLVSLVIGVLSQIGDLFESAFKRHFGVKDSSNLIPGHGGLFDRVDGLMFAAMVAALISLYFGPSDPGQTLLVWSTNA